MRPFYWRPAKQTKYPIETQFGTGNGQSSGLKKWQQSYLSIRCNGKFLATTGDDEMMAMVLNYSKSYWSCLRVFERRTRLLAMQKLNENTRRRAPTTPINWFAFIYAWIWFEFVCSRRVLQRDALCWICSTFLWGDRIPIWYPLGILFGNLRHLKAQSLNWMTSTVYGCAFVDFCLNANLEAFEHIS